MYLGLQVEIKRYFQKNQLRKGEIILEKHGYQEESKLGGVSMTTVPKGQMPSSCGGGRTSSGHPAFKGFQFE